MTSGVLSPYSTLLVKMRKLEVVPRENVDQLASGTVLLA